jgi:hypothetical protein
LPGIETDPSSLRGRNEDTATRRAKLLVTGCGRSGTNYTTVLLRRCGIDVPHEHYVGADGISSWMFAVRGRSAPRGPAPFCYEFDHVVHQVRNPLMAIPSITTFREESWEYIAQYIAIDLSDPPLLRAARYWIEWNEIVERRAELRIRIEDMPAAVLPLARLIGVHIDPAFIPEVPKDINTRRHGILLNYIEHHLMRLGLVRRRAWKERTILATKPQDQTDLTWANLERLDAELADRIRAKARLYGYAE